MSWTMKKKWLVTGDHPVLRRPDKYFDFDQIIEAEEYAAELRKVSYDNVEIKEV